MKNIKKEREYSEVLLVTGISEQAALEIIRSPLYNKKDGLPYICFVGNRFSPMVRERKQQVPASDQPEAESCKKNSSHCSENRATR